MTTAALYRDDLMPRAAKGLGPGLVLAVLVHIVLVIALAFNVNWRASEPEGLQAELWAAVPQVAAPRAVEPEPKPEPVKPTPPPVKVETPPRPAVDPQIAIEKEKQQKKLEQQKRDQEKQEEKQRQDKAEADRKKQDLDRKKKDDAQQAAQIEAQRQANLKRILGQAGATGDPTSTGKAAQTAGPSAGYAGRIKGRIKPNILLTDNVEGNPTAEVEVRAAPDGTIIARKLVKSSGSKEWDDAVLRAIDRTEILPRDTDGTVPSPMVIAFRPRDF